MATLNTSHHSGGGVLLYNGELILLFCDQVNCEVLNKGSAKGPIYLTTHRIVFTAQPINQNPQFQSLSAPFSALYDLSLEQPVFGANYIKGRLRTDSSLNTSATTQNEFQFKLKFSRGGAIEFGQALREAARRVQSYAPSSMDSSAFSTPFAPNEYYQSPDSVYQPNYPVGFALPTHIFSQAPPPGFVYTYNLPPPYPGIGRAVDANMPQSQTYPYTPTTSISLGTSVQYPAYPVAFQAAPASYVQSQYLPPQHQPSQPQYPQYPPTSQQQSAQYPPTSQQQSAQYPPTSQQQSAQYPQQQQTGSAPYGHQPPPSYSAQNSGPPGYTPESYPTKQ